MKTKREMPLAEALDEIASAVRELKEKGSARVNGNEIKLADKVMLEIEEEAEKGKAEIEFEIKWPVKRRRRGRVLLGAVAGAAIGAAALTVVRRRHATEEEAPQ